MPALLLAGLLTVVLVVTPASGGGRKAPRAADARVLVKDNFFTPRSLTVEEGDTVKWVWRGKNRHNVVFTKAPRGAGRRRAKARRSGRWLRTFRKPGQYRYVCTLFAGMRGSVRVEEEPEPASSAQGPATVTGEAGPGADARR